MNVPRVIFIDTSYFVALLNGRDPAHARAHRWDSAVRAAGCRFVTTEAVLWEFLNMCAAPALRGLAYQVYLRSRSDPRFTIADSALLHQEATQLYSDRIDKWWGIVDCLSFVVMSHEGIDSALTADHHFQQAGLRALLLEEPEL